MGESQAWCMLHAACCRLPKLISHLSSSSARIRKQALAILGTVSARLQADHATTLPLAQLVELFEESADAPFAATFCLAFLKQNAGRRAAVPDDEAPAAGALPASVLVRLLHGLASRPLAQREAVRELFAAQLPILTLDIGALVPVG